MRSLRPPYDVIAEELQQTARITLTLPAVAHGIAYPLTLSPYAIDRMHTYGVGVYQVPRTERLFVPCRCIVLQVSADRSVWMFALNNHLRMRIEIRSDQPLPHGFAQAEPAQVLEPGVQFARLHHTLLGAETTILTSVQQITTGDSSPHYFASPFSGEMRASEDTVLRLYLADHDQH